MSLSGDKEVAQFKKSVEMGHPNMYTYFVLGAYYLTPAPWIFPIVGTFGDIVGDTVRALEQRGAEAANTSL